MPVQACQSLRYNQTPQYIARMTMYKAKNEEKKEKREQAKQERLGQRYVPEKEDAPLEQEKVYEYGTGNSRPIFNSNKKVSK